VDQGVSRPGWSPAELVPVLAMDARENLDEKWSEKKNVNALGPVFIEVVRREISAWTGLRGKNACLGLHQPCDQTFFKGGFTFSKYPMLY
jgi:hypothetical protein